MVKFTMQELSEKSDDVLYDLMVMNDFAETPEDAMERYNRGDMIRLLLGMPLGHYRRMFEDGKEYVVMHDGTRYEVRYDGWRKVEPYVFLDDVELASEKFQRLQEDETRKHIESGP